MSLRVAACAYPVEATGSFADYAQKQARWVEAAVEQGAQLLVFPEYAAVELASTLDAAVRGELRRELEALQALLPGVISTFGELAQKHAVWILAPSFPERDSETGRFHNRARVHAPSGNTALIEKLQMTRFESEEWGISPGKLQQVLETPFGTMSVAICYDSEFPQLVRKQVELGSQLVLVPSNTDTLAGYHRVALSCRARALENQCFVVHAPTVGSLPDSLAIDHNRGAAAVYGPVDRGFADDGVVARGAFDTPGWVMADLDFAALDRVRADGQVRNHRDWEQPAHKQPITQRTRLD